VLDLGMETFSLVGESLQSCMRRLPRVPRAVCAAKGPVPASSSEN